MNETRDQLIGVNVLLLIKGQMDRFNTDDLLKLQKSLEEQVCLEAQTPKTDEVRP